MSTDRAAPMEFAKIGDGWLVGRFAALSALDGFSHAASTRTGPGGASLASDDPGGKARRLSLARAIGAEQVAGVHQVHGVAVATADDALAGEVQADALMTDRRGVALLGLSADCPIVLLADPTTGAVAMAHASWRSTVGGVTTRLVAAMRDAYRCDPGDLHAGICPSAGPCCYEVGDDVIVAAGDSVPTTCFVQRRRRTTFDLWAANVHQLTDAGVDGQNIEVAGVCSICDNRFFSYRREGPRAGRQGGMIVKV